MADEKKEEVFSLEEVTVFVTRDAEGNEGVVTIVNPAGQLQPMLAFDNRNFEQMKGIAQGIADETRQKITVAKFSLREDVEVLDPKQVKLVTLE